MGFVSVVRGSGLVRFGVCLMYVARVTKGRDQGFSVCDQGAFVSRRCFFV